MLDIHALLDWSRFEFLFKDIYSSRKGELAWPPLMMFKALLLQAWHNLSDPALEKALARDLLFRGFVGVCSLFTIRLQIHQHRLVFKVKLKYCMKKQLF